MCSCTIPICILTVPFVPTCKIVYRPSLGADSFCQRPGFRNIIRTSTLYLCFILFRFSLLLEVAIIFYLFFLIISQFAAKRISRIISLPKTNCPGEACRVVWKVLLIAKSQACRNSFQGSSWSNSLYSSSKALSSQLPSFLEDYRR
jgi:hypothetical protein